jgi:hypothetical protein
MLPPFEGGLVAEFGEPWAHVREIIHDGVQEVHLQVMLGARDRICYCFVRRVREKQLPRRIQSRLTPVL